MKTLHILLIAILSSCVQSEDEIYSTTEKNEDLIEQPNDSSSSITEVQPFADTLYNSAHLFVALCDNKYQAIAPVPERIGNGQNPKSNLYWGAGYGVKNYFLNKSSDWELIRSEFIDSTILERLILKHREHEFFLIADAYNGKEIYHATLDFLSSSAGLTKDTLVIRQDTIGIHGNAKMSAYIGHDGLMEFNIFEEFQNSDSLQRDVIVLACFSKLFFEPQLENSNTNKLVWTTGLMAPEAYTFHDALNSYLNGDSTEQVRTKAAEAYHQYQRCGINGARRLLVSN